MSSPIYFKKPRPSLACFLALLLAAFFVPDAQAVDDGQTHPKLTVGGMSWGGGTNLAYDVIPLTSGAGNVKGFFCWSQNGALGASSLQIYVDGGSAQTLNLIDAPTIQDNDGVIYSTGWVPLNTRFGSSIKVRLTRTHINYHIVCHLSWGLD